MPSKESTQLKRTLHSYHEAGHAVVWHVVGGLIEEVSIASSPTGYGDIAALVCSSHYWMTSYRQMGGSGEAGLIPGRSRPIMPACLLWPIIVPRMQGRTSISRAASGTI